MIIVLVKNLVLNGYGNIGKNVVPSFGLTDKCVLPQSIGNGNNLLDGWNVKMQLRFAQSANPSKSLQNTHSILLN